MKTLLRNLMVLYLLVLAVTWGALVLDTGQTWWVSLFVFSPRWLLAVPWLLLFPLTLWLHVRIGLFYVLHLAILLLAILDFRWALAAQQPAGLAHAPTLRLLTCNLGEGQIDVERLKGLVGEHFVDVLVLQECTHEVSTPLFEQLGWQYQQHANLAIGTSLPCGPLQLLSRRGAEAYGAPVAVGADIILRSGLTAVRAEDALASDEPAVIRVISVHLPTFRPAFEKAEQFDISGGEDFKALAELYRGYAAHALDEATKGQVATVLAGDFNVPVDSPFYRDYWQSFQNALSLRGRGLCYTKFTRFHGVRIDHVLADKQWWVQRAEVGPSLGGDHRPVMVELRLKTMPKISTVTRVPSKTGQTTAGTLQPTQVVR
jgi:vancomycin resistance protein VanJ